MQIQENPHFQVLKTNQDLKTALGWKSVQGLTLLGKHKSTHYSTLFLKKKGASGKSKKPKIRVLRNPDGLMRAVQFRILTKLFEKIEVPPYIYAFEKEKSIPVMAQMHVGKPLVVSLDIKDFFPSITQHMVQDLMMKLGSAEEPARTLSELCTYGPRVPQGALTSPKLSNIIAAATFGPEVHRYCEDRGYYLSVYADDITVSTDRNLIQEEGKESVTALINDLGNIVESFGFRINHRKTKVMRSSQRQYVCGAVVNSQVNLQKKQRNRLRAMVHNVAMNGVEAEAAKANLSVEKFTSVLMGQVNWFQQLNPSAGTLLKDKLKDKVKVTAYQEAKSDVVHHGTTTNDVQTPGPSAAVQAAVATSNPPAIAIEETRSGEPLEVPWN